VTPRPCPGDGRARVRSPIAPFVVALALLLPLLLPAWAGAALSIPPPPTRRVNDYAGALSAADRDRLEQKLAAAEQKSQNQVVVGIFRSLEGESLEDYSIRLAEAWRIGQKGLDNGVIFLIFLNDRKMRLEVGYGLEGTLTDAVSTSILQDVVAPRFRAGQTADGIGAGLDAIQRAIAGTYRRPADGERESEPGLPFGVIAIGFVALIIGISIASAIANSRRHGWTGDHDGWAQRNTRRRSGWPIVFFPPGESGGRSGGGFGGGGGGFSGGGGGFGGGGASGDW
jgi:uncharacterized protein